MPIRTFGFSHLQCSSHPQNSFLDILSRMRSCDEGRDGQLPIRVDALRRLFRAALWCVRLMPKRERRVVAIFALRTLPWELKRIVLAQAKMLRITAAHSGHIWSTHEGDMEKRIMAPSRQ